MHTWVGNEVQTLKENSKVGTPWTMFLQPSGPFCLVFQKSQVPYGPPIFNNCAFVVGARKIRLKIWQHYVGR